MAIQTVLALFAYLHALRYGQDEQQLALFKAQSLLELFQP